jgi:hypothetical protein
MKKLSRKNKIELILWSLVLLSIALKLFGMPGSSLLLILFVTILAFYYLIGGYFVLQEKWEKYPVTSIAAGLCLGIIPMAVMFKIQRWPGSAMLLMLGLVTALIFFVISFVKKSSADGVIHYYQRMIWRTLALGTLTLIFLMTSTITFISIQYRNQPELKRLLIQCEREPMNKEYRQELWDYEERMMGFRRNHPEEN